VPVQAQEPLGLGTGIVIGLYYCTCAELDNEPEMVGRLVPLKELDYILMIHFMYKANL